MPSTYNLPRSQDAWSSQDVNVYNKLPFHLALLGAKFFPKWQRWSKVLGSRNWMPNMGTELRGIKVEPTPVGRQMFFPNAITSQPNRDVYEIRESLESAVLYRHNYESPYINFLGPFQDFRRQQVPNAMTDLTTQIATAQDMFSRTQIFHKCPNVLISGKAITNNADGFDGDDFLPAPTGLGSSDGSTAKSTAWLQQALAYVGNNQGNFSYKLAKKCGTIMTEDIQAPPFEGMANMPKPDEIIKGKYVIMGSNEAYEHMEFDDFLLATKSQLREFIGTSFNGPIGSKVMWMSERFPLRVKDDGTFPAPQVFEVNPNAWNYGETVPNPDYINAKFEIAFVIAASSYEQIDVGPPPKEFASSRMDARKFAELRWNGEVRLTDDLLINVGTPAAPIMTTNKYGEFVQLIADTTHGIIPIQRRHCFPVIYRRARVQTS